MPRLAARSGIVRPRRRCNPSRLRLVLTLDFSVVSTDGGPDGLRRSFLEAVRGQVLYFVLTYQNQAPKLRDLEERLYSLQDAETILSALMSTVRASGHKLYVLIDEYDTFANSLLSAGQEDLYSAVVERTGFIRTFYRTLKRGTQSGAVGRLFITGVSPILLDDLASGFNIATNISQKQELTERVFNADMVLWFLMEVREERGVPRGMLDPNVRTDYGKLQRLGLLTGTGAAARRALLQTILSDGAAHGELVDQFGAKSLSSHDQFLSLLYYVGMLTLAEQPVDATPVKLEIPNRVIRELQWTHLALMLKEQEGLELDTRELEASLRSMAVDGDIEPFLSLFHERVIKAMGVKDLRQLSEKTIKLMMLTFISLSRVFHPLSESEKEFAQGYCDLFLGVSPLVHVARFAWLLELKYLRTDAKPSEIEAAFEEAALQLARYAADPHLVPLLTRDRDLKAGALVFVGAQAVSFRPFGGAPG